MKDKLFHTVTKWNQGILLVAIIALATILRLYRLDQLPPGLHFDEAFDAVHAEKVLAGVERPIFFPDNLAEEPMSIYAAAGVFAVFGSSPWALRLSSGLAGVCTVAALYFLAQQLFPGAAKRRIAFAALAALVLAVLYWHLNFSRLGMEPIFLPFMLTLSFAFLWRGIRRLSDHGRDQQIAEGREQSKLAHFISWLPTALLLRQAFQAGWADLAVGGLFFGAVQYTYKAGLFAPFIIAIFLVVEFVINRPFWYRCWRGFAIFTLVAVLVFAPLGLYFVSHPEQFLERPTAVTATSLDVATLANNALRVAGMFFIQGDENPRSNLPGRPVLDPFLALGFIAGLVACLLRLRTRHQRDVLEGAGARFLLLWLIVMVLPSVVTDYSPHFGRSIGATPALALLVAVGFVELYELAQKQVAGSQARIRKVAPIALFFVLVVGLAASAYSSIHAYFDVWGTRTGLFDSFDAGYLAMAQKLRERPANEQIYLSPFEDEHYTIQYGLGGREARQFDGRRVLVLPPPGSTATYGLVTREDKRSLGWLTQFFPNGRIVEGIDDLTGAPYASMYRIEGAPQIAPQKLVHARLGDTIELIGYDRGRATDAITLTVYWGSIAETQANYTVFVHLIGPLNSETQSTVWAQEDALPGHGAYPTPRWQAGEVIVDEYRLVVPANRPRGEYQIEVGMYLYQTGARVRVTDADGASMENDRVLFERITLP